MLKKQFKQKEIIYDYSLLKSSKYIKIIKIYNKLLQWVLYKNDDKK